MHERLTFFLYFSFTSFNDHVMNSILLYAVVICRFPLNKKLEDFRSLFLDWTISCFICLLILFHCKLSPYTHTQTLSTPCLSSIMLSLAGRGTRWGKLSNYHALLNYAALISWLGSSGTASAHIGTVIFSSERHLFHSFRATTTKINNVWIMSQKKRCCIHLSPCHLHVRNKEQTSLCHNLCRTTEAEINFAI